MEVRTGWKLDKFGFSYLCVDGHESGEWVGDPECCIQAVMGYDAYRGS